MVFINYRKSKLQRFFIPAALILCFITSSFRVEAQSIWTNPITATNPNTANPYTAGQTVNGSISVSGIGRGAGITGAAAIDRYNATGWNTGSFDATDYFEFTLTPNSGCNISFASFVYTAQASGTGPVSFAIRSSLDGFVANIGAPNVTGTTISLAALTYQNITTAITFRLYGWGASSAAGSWSINDFTFNGTVTCGATNSINTGSVSGAPFSLASCATTTTGTVAFISGGTFAAGNVYTAQLSDAFGSFASPVTVGTLNSTANSGTITITIPAGTPSGTGYQVMIVSSNPSVTGTSSGTFSVISGCNICPHLTGAFINACDGSCMEGDNEILFLNSGSSSIPVSPANIKVFYGNTAALSSSADNFTESFTTSPSIINNLNTLAGCGTLFYDASVVGTIPANSVFMIMRNTACFNFDFSSFCYAGPIYVLFSTDASWTVGGNFVNGAAAGVLRYFKTDFSAVTAGCVINYNYEPNQLVGGDGAGISFPDAGGAASSYYNSGCSPPSIILPVNLLDFYATQHGDGNDLSWKVSSEAGTRNYILEKSANGIDFSPLGIIPSRGEEQSMDYSARDLSPYEGITYYRLSAAGTDGSVKAYKIIDADRQSLDWKSVIYQQDDRLVVEFKNYLPKGCSYAMLDLSGRTLCSGSLSESLNSVDISGISAGLYFLSISTPYKVVNTKIVIHK